MKRSCVNAWSVGIVSVALLTGHTAPLASDAAEQAAALERLKAQIERQVRDYQQYPRKRFIGANAREHRFVRYEQEWVGTIERVGTANFPPEARGRLTGNVRLSVSINSDGSVESVSIDRSSGHEILDQGAMRIVRLASPFVPFPPEIRKDTDILVITKTWHFVAGESDRVSGK